MFDMEINIEGIDKAGDDDKFAFIEDIHAMGDVELLESEATKWNNKSNVITMIVLFLIVGVAAIVCCYLNY